MKEKIIECFRDFDGSTYHDHVTITICITGWHNEERCSKHLTIEETKELIKRLQRLVELK